MRVAGTGWWISTLLSLLLFAAPPGVEAQSADAEGVWWSLGVGVGWNRLGCDLCDGDRDFGPAGRVAFGGVVRPGFLLGIEGNGWTFSDDDEDSREKAGSITGVAYLFPDPTRGFFVKGGVGYVGYWVEDFNYDAIALQFGVGYSFPVYRDFVISNSLNLVASSFGSLKNDEDTISDEVSQSLIQFGISIQAR